MTPRERFLNALARRPVDRTPVVSPTSIVTVELQEQAGAFFPEAHLDSEAMARLALAGHTICGYDTVFPAFGAGTQEVAALGVAVDWRDRSSLPNIGGPIWERPEDVAIPDDFLDRRSVQATLDAIRILRRELGERVAIIGKIYGPWSLAYHTFGLQRFLKCTIKDPGFVAAVLERLIEVALLYGQAQIEAGADALTLGDHITANLIRAEAYPRFLAAHHRRLASELSAPLIFHCCGRTLDRIGCFADGHAAAFHFESSNDAVAMRSQAAMALAGNINGPQTLYNGTPEDVRREVFYALDAGVDLIAPECAVPPIAPLANVTAVRQAVDAYFEAGHVPGGKA